MPPDPDLVLGHSSEIPLLTSLPLLTPLTSSSFLPILRVGRTIVTNRADLLESALNALAHGIALADSAGQIALWNRAAEMITGWETQEVTGCSARQIIDEVMVGGMPTWLRHASVRKSGDRGMFLTFRHKNGHEVRVHAHVLFFHDGIGGTVGAGVLFHPMDGFDSLLHGIPARITETQSEFEDRLVCMHEAFRRGDLSLGVMLVRVDQAQEFRKSHGSGACEAMLQRIEATIASGLKPVDVIGRWGDHDLLVLTEERNDSALTAHAQVLAGLARTAEFCWWGDRISLTVTIGTARARSGESLHALLERAKAAVESKSHVPNAQLKAAEGTF
jgi:PAS domain S-box-containing protein